MSEVYIEKTEVSPALRPQSAEEVLLAAKNVIERATKENEEIDTVYVTSQTFNEHVMPRFLNELIERTELSPNFYVHEQVYSNMQPILHQAFSHVERTRKRILLIGIEALSLLDEKERPQIIGKGLGSNPDFQKLGTMASAISFLSAVWARELGIQMEDLKARMMEKSLLYYERSGLNPDSQFFGKKAPTPEQYQANYGHWIDRSGMFTKYDCAPGNSSQVAAMVVSADEKKAKARVMGWETVTDKRSLKDRLGFKNVKNEAVYQAFDSALRKAGLKRGDLMNNGTLEIHNAFSPLVFMTLHEMGYLNVEEMKKPWGQMEGIDTRRINTMGGLKSGHPLGATALVRFHEVLQQLSGTAPKELQLEGLEYGAIQSVAGARHKISVTLVGGV